MRLGDWEIGRHVIKRGEMWFKILMTFALVNSFIPANARALPLLLPLLTHSLTHSLANCNPHCALLLTLWREACQPLPQSQVLLGVVRLSEWRTVTACFLPHKVTWFLLVSEWLTDWLTEWVSESVSVNSKRNEWVSESMSECERQIVSVDEGVGD